MHHNYLLKWWKTWKNLTFAWAKFVFQTFKNHQFCQKMSMSRFPPSGKITKWTKFAFSNFYCKDLEFSKAASFVKRDPWVDFHQARSSQNKQSLLFQDFEVLELSPSPSFVKRVLWVDFHQTGILQKWNDAKKEFVWINIGQITMFNFWWWCKKCCRFW